MVRSQQQPFEAANLGRTLREQAVQELAQAGALDSPEDVPMGAVVKLMVSSALVPQRNAASSLKALTMLLDMKGRSKSATAAELESELASILNFTGKRS